MIRKFIVAIILLVVAAHVWYSLPKKIEKVYNGVEFQLGSDNEEKVTIYLKGKLTKSLFGEKIFRGTLQINDEIIPSGLAYEDTIEVVFGKVWVGGIIQYLEHTDDGLGQIYSYGIIYVNEDFTELTIAKNEQSGNGNSEWNGENGRMISAPASNRVEALAISNRLLKDIFQIELE
ncbi:hypothetical protein DS745_02860 [Anaerobacillus alkaliphilus]|uniref:Uncharacterized protein n=1 Tax=Anaerobacillus alkaliphilus TaxID=1548597 RepID=A0A4Q0VY50_9BACI|nr:hypothetical protein [Anaerobacillus alkaliphilus]RXJ04342.1 hypothetical protein DS745_02860 [Anaerobacillus alkaliphilus]